MRVPRCMIIQSNVVVSEPKAHPERSQKWKRRPTARPSETFALGAKKPPKNGKEGCHVSGIVLTVSNSPSCPGSGDGPSLPASLLLSRSPAPRSQRASRCPPRSSRRSGCSRWACSTELTPATNRSCASSGPKGKPSRAWLAPSPSEQKA